VSYDGSPPKLRKVSIEGGDPVPLTEEFAQHPTFSPDGKMIAYYRMDMEKRERRDIVIIPAGGGAPIKTLPAPKNFGSVMIWTTAGDALLSRQHVDRSLAAATRWHTSNPTYESARRTPDLVSLLERWPLARLR
jgi:hypothetical protein